MRRNEQTSIVVFFTVANWNIFEIFGQLVHFHVEHGRGLEENGLPHDARTNYRYFLVHLDQGGQIADMVVVVMSENNSINLGSGHAHFIK